MADWGNYVIQGGLTKTAPNMTNDPNWKILAYFVFPPKAGSYHVIEPPLIEMGIVDDAVILPSNYLNLYPTKPNDEFPVGDWSQGSKVYRLYEDQATGEKYKVEFSLVGFKTLLSAGRNPLGTGFISLVIGSFNAATFGLFANNMGGWLVTEIIETSGNSSSGTSGFGSTFDNIRDQFEDAGEQAANKKREQARNSRKLMTWLGYGLLGYGIARKNTKVAISGGLVLAYTRNQKVKALEDEFNSKIDSLVPSIFQ
jgi:hypothetical protein|tara:strand:+ start:644 stop:1408 length:765 start_codon:yes stop_codon:yes gene_type:complete